MCVIFLDKCLVMHLPFVSMIKFKFLAHFPGDPLANLHTLSCIALYSFCDNLLHSVM